ncbi:DUF6934 family protein [Chitinophaga ginsengisoli]|uniref:Uncharacterized protein n=1 Tax=Chitinophaga ginsengisoli TaxID=363837 RepID=A0A2P8FTG5_9BACT|nr:hypothetical protein [Chitinophaga ginsengisoli]PSL25012.1 hypothetical protein CLV42_114161 [Chitinophaga ginsengisoli]
MHLDHYLFTMTSKTDRKTDYEFTSIGPKGEIKKTVRFMRISHNFYNLSFGEIDKRTNGIVDNVNSGNNDHEMILTTVAAVVESFTIDRPDSFIYVEGSTPSRTRLYRICITKYLSDITNQFKIFGYQNNEWQNFTQNQAYNAFLGIRNLS